MKLIATTLLLFSTLHAATIVSSTYCPRGVSQPSFCTGPNESATTSLASTVARVETAASNPTLASPSYAYGRLDYDAIFDITVNGSGSGLLLPVLEVWYSPDSRISATATARLGQIAISGSSGLGGGYNSTLNGCYLACALPITFGVMMPVELRLYVEASTGFALFPPGTTSAASMAQAALSDLWFFQNGHRVSNSFTFAQEFTVTTQGDQTPVPEPGYTVPVFLMLGAWLVVFRGRKPHARVHI